MYPLQHSSRDLAVLALERLVERSSHIQQVFTALRCLIRLKLTMINSDAVEKMYDRLVIHYYYHGMPNGYLIYPFYAGVPYL